MGNLKFAPNTVSKNSSNNLKKWKILICDDEPDVHAITKTVLANFSFENKHLEFISSFTAYESKEILKKESHIAILLLDVVMESDDAGLNLVKYVREELNNQDIRIILRTGQAGSAPEKKIISLYDINDYKEKTELTTTKLYTTITTALRSYKDLQTIKNNQRALEYIIEQSKKISTQFFGQNNFLLHAIKGYIKLINIYEEPHTSYKRLDGFFVEYHEDSFKNLHCLGGFSKKNFNLTEYERELMDTVKLKELRLKEERIMFSLRSSQSEYIFYFRHQNPISKELRGHLQLYISNIQITLNNYILCQEQQFL